MKKLILIFILTLITSCLSRVEKHGYMFDLSDYQMLEEGISSQEKTISLMGFPSFSSDLSGKEVWFYYAQEVRYLLFFKPKILSRKIMALEFNDGIVEKINYYDLANENQKLNFATKYTAIDGHELGILKGIFGNVGQVRPQ